MHRNHYETPTTVKENLCANLHLYFNSPAQSILAKLYYMKNYLTYYRDIFLCLAVVYLLSFIGIALLCIWYINQHFLQKRNANAATGFSHNNLQTPGN